MLTTVIALGNVLSWRYHFGFQNYAPFVTEQVMPREGGFGAARALLGRSVERGADGGVRLDEQPFDSPLPSQEDPLVGRAVMPAGSDFLAMWHFLRVIEARADPYRNLGSICYNLPDHLRGPVPIMDNHVPTQVVGTGMSYLPSGPFLIFPFFHDNYFMSLASYLLTLKLFAMGALAWVLRRSTHHRAALGAVFLTLLVGCHPFDVLIDRGNTEGIVLMLLAGFYAAWRRGRDPQAAAFLGVAASAKIFPAVLLLLFVAERKYKAFALGVATFLGINLAALMALPVPSAVALRELIDNITLRQRMAAVEFDAVRFGQSLQNLARVTLALVRRDEAPAQLGALGPACTVLSLVLLGTILWRLRRVDPLARATALTSAMVLLPAPSTTYHLVHLAPPLVLTLLQIERAEARTVRPALQCLLIALIFVPKGYLVGFKGLGLLYGLSPLLNPLLLLALIAVSLTPDPAPVDA